MSVRVNDEYDCESIQDYVSRELCEETLASGQEYVDWLETQLGLIGLKNYLQSAMEDSS